MDIESFNRRESMLRLREELLSVEENRLTGARYFSVDETVAMMKQAVREKLNG
jgi:hypothetical protein